MLFLLITLMGISLLACESAEYANQQGSTADNETMDIQANAGESPASAQQSARIQSDDAELTDPQLENARWILIELNGRIIERVRDPRKINYVHFHGDGQRVHAFAGCNHMSGIYEISTDGSLSFSQLIATRMACEDMENEHQLSEILENTHSYSISDGILSLNVPGRDGAAKLERE